jgi:D-alanyl-D-alanine carboxypeptidase
LLSLTVRLVSVIVVFLVFAIAGAPAQAATYSGIVVDAKTGKTLYGYRENAKAYPASLTKMMTLYLLFEAMEAGKLSKSSRITFSDHAASMQPTKLGIKPGHSITVEQAILALVTKSANDAAAAVAEKLGGTESGFAEMMTAKAHELGMSRTTFRNASGLPNSRQTTTARDMATLGIALREHFPQYYGYFSTRAFKFAGRRMGNHNHLLGRVKGMDGIKTGYTRASGFNLVSSVETDGRSIVAVVMGGRTGKSRNQQMVKLIRTYLRKASRGKDRMVVARKGANPFEVAELPKQGPAPVYRVSALDPASQRIASAHTVSASATGFDVAAIERRLRQLSGHELPVPDRSPAIDAEVRTAAVPKMAPVAFAAEPDQKPAAAVEAIARNQSGWQIQIAAVPSRDAALKLLKKARGKAPRTLAKVRNYTEETEKNGVTLYRARFSGFASKSAAWDACGKLKKKSFACLAIYN